MEMEAEAERRRRAEVLQSEGDRQSEVNLAQGAGARGAVPGALGGGLGGGVQHG